MLEVRTKIISISNAINLLVVTFSVRYGSMFIRNVYTSDNFYSPETMPKEMAFPVYEVILLSTLGS